MKIESHTVNHIKIAEIITDDTLLKSPEDGLDLLGNLYYQGFDSIIIHQKNLSPAFFDLKNGIAGEILQKFSNYRVRLAIIGDFRQYTTKSMTDFIYESNKTAHINFVGSREEALKKLASK